MCLSSKDYEEAPLPEHRRGMKQVQTCRREMISSPLKKLRKNQNYISDHARSGEAK
jgi:hypothetical protein